MFNKSILMGRICNNLELKTTPSGVSVLSFRIAVERAYQAQGEERMTDFFNIVAWRSTAEFISKYFYKGRMILLEGELQTRQYQDKNGISQNVVELVVSSAHFSGEKKELGQANAQSAAAPNALPAQGQGCNDFVETGNDDDYPF